MTDARPLSISVAMATYNGGKYLRQQLADLAAQRLAPAELVICDDGSTDDTCPIIEEFAASVPFPVRLHRNPERLGYRANFLKCATLCSSDLIAFCDQDDRWDRRKLEVMYAPFADEEVLLAYHNARPVTDAGKALPVLYPRGPDRIFSPLTLDPWFSPLGFTQIIRRSLVGHEDLWALSVDQNHEQERLAHDQWYFLLAVGLGSVAYLPVVLADYRQHGANTYGVSWFRILVPGLTEYWHATIGRKQRLTATRGRSLIFRELAQRFSGEWRQRATMCAQWYDRLAERISARSGFYDGVKFKQRWPQLKQLWRTNAYGSGPSQFHRVTLAGDLTIGLLGAFTSIARLIQGVVVR
jgi:glycosyltransferase involved in cell wall biosynthesis